MSGSIQTLRALEADIAAKNANLSAAAKLSVTTPGNLTTDGTEVVANQLDLKAQSLSNIGGVLLHTGSGDFSLSLLGNLANIGGSIAANAANMTLGANDFDNTDGIIQHVGSGRLDVGVTALNGTRGLVQSNGSLNLKAGSATLDQGSTLARQISIDSATLSNMGGEILQTGSEAASVKAATAFDNRGGTLSSNGDTTLAVGMLNNQGGLIQTASASSLGASESKPAASLAISADGVIDNSALKDADGNLILDAHGHPQGGMIRSGGNTQITGASIDNQQGTLTAEGSLSGNLSQGIINRSGLIAANGAVEVTAGSINNVEGTLASIVSDATLNVGNGFDNSRGTLSASRALSVSSQEFNNIDGWSQGQQVTFDSRGYAFENTRGILIASLSLDFLSGAVNNDAGLMQSGGDLKIDTQGQKLTNINSGTDMGLLAQGKMHVVIGALDNHSGTIGANGEISAETTTIDNKAGSIFGSSTINLAAGSMDNQAGRIEALDNVTLDVVSTAAPGASKTLDNRGGLLRSGKTLSLTAVAVDNRNTSSHEQGIEADVGTINSNALDNRSGAIRADSSLIFTGSDGLNNGIGLISSAGSLDIADRQAQAGSNVADKTLALTNSGGTLIAGTRLDIDSKSLSGDGKVLSQGDLTTKITTDYTHNGEWQANGTATLQTTGKLTNQARLLAGGGLSLSAASLDNLASGEIAGIQTTLTIANTLTNRGLIDGGENFISAGTLDNLGSGRIYGDHLAIAATTINIDDETVNGVLRSAVIAARERLDIGTKSISNQNGALLFSAGDMNIGGGLDINRHPTGSALELTNLGATIEALGNINISATKLKNLNAEFVTAQVVVSQEAIAEYSGRGSGNRYSRSQVNLVPHEDFTRLSAPDGLYNNWYLYQYTRTIQETKVTRSAPGQLLAGGNLLLKGDVLLNDKSEIIAGGTISGDLANLTNSDASGTKKITNSGRVIYYYRDKEDGDDDQGVVVSSYNPAPTNITSGLSVARYQQQVSPGGTGTKIAALDSANVAQTAGGAGDANVVLSQGREVSVVTEVTANSGVAGSGPNILNGASGNFQAGKVEQVPSVTANEAGKPATIIRSAAPNTAVPNNSLYRTQVNPRSHYLVETDPAFANYRTWLSSDYMLQQLALDPALTQKRLGDGFYEQRLVREQLAQLTGRRFLDGYANDETQYQALMTAGVTYGQTWGLVPGVALTEAQMAQLTSDIVWLVVKTVTLPDGGTQQVLAPQVYVRVQEGDLLHSGTLIAGYNIDLQLDGDLINGGTIAGRNAVSLSADNIRNLGGRIAGNQTILKARTDIDQLGGRIEGGDALILQAGGDLNVASTVRGQTSAQGSRTNLDRVAGLYVSNSDAILVASAGRDFNLIAAQVQSTGEAGATVLAAGRDLNLGAVTTGASEKIGNSKHNRAESSQSEIGSTIDTQGDVTLLAGRDLTARAAQVGSNGAIVAQAGNDLNIEAGAGSQTLEENHRYQSKGLLSSKKTTTYDRIDETGVVSSTFSGETVSLEAGRDMTVKGSNVVGSGKVSLTAGNNIALDTAQATRDKSHLKKTSKSGVFGNGAGITVGSQKLKNTNDSQQVTNVGSTVGSVEGNVNIEAGKRYTQTGSAVLAPQGDIDILAQQVDINAATDTYAAQQTTKFKSSGLSVSVSSSLVNLGEQMASSAKNTFSGDAGDQRLHALQTYANGATQYEQGANVGKALQAGKVEDAAQAAGAKISVSLGTSKSASSSSTQISTQQASTVMGGGNVNIQATQDDLTVAGSEIAAGQDLKLAAAKNLNLVAGQDTEANRSKNKFSSASIGVSAGVGGGFAGVSVDATISRGKGNANSDSTSYNNTHVSAGETLTLESGSDTNLIGANAAGKQVIAKVDGDLNIQSLQDTATSKAKQSNTGFSVSVPVVSPTGLSASASQSREKANSHYAGVYEQSGIQAGDKGFDINVQGNTDLSGAVINSAALADKNKLTTGTLTVSDIKNHMDASASSSGTTLSSDMITSKYAAAKGLVRNALDTGEADTKDSSTSKSAIAPGRVIITDDKAQQALTGQSAEQTVAALNRDTTNTNWVLAKPDVQALQDKAQQERADNMLLYNTTVAFTDEAFLRAFLEKAKIYKIVRHADGTPELNADGKPVMVDISDEEKRNLKADANGKVNVYTNGIYNDADLAATYATQMADPNAGEVYMVYFPEANNVVSELLIAGYQKFMESTTLGLTNATLQVIDLSQTYGGEGLNLVGHSRGAMTIGNALEGQQEMGATGSLSKTDIRLYGPAYNTQEATDRLDALNGDADPAQSSLKAQTHQYDFVGRIVGGNPGTGGTIPSDSSVAGELINVFIGNTTVHNSYENGRPDGTSKAYWQDFPGGKPISTTVSPVGK